MKLSAPSTLGTRGQALWDALTALHDLSPEQHVTLEEACRTADRLDRLDALVNGEVDLWASLTHDLRTESYVLRIDGALSEARQQQTVLKQLLAALRLPDEAGKKPQYRGARGAYVPTGKAAPVSSLARARAAKSS